MIKTFKHKKTAIIIVMFFSIILVTTGYKWLSQDKALKIAYDESLSAKNKYSEMVAHAYAAEESPKAFYILYYMLYHGEGTPVSPKTALLMLKKSAKAGYGPAQEELGFIYLEGNEYYNKDVNLANYWLHKAADSGMPMSQDYLYLSS
ncbi:MAG: TPR repeat protein [Oleiphilaceae bacterium]|jgi:TPR repeat protein